MQNKEDLDSFWDIDKLVPTKKTSAAASFSTKEKTVTVIVDGEETESDDRCKLTVTEKTLDDEKVYLYAM